MGYDGITDLFLQNVSKTPDKVAIVFEYEALTYTELAGKVELCVKNLEDVGIKFAESSILRYVSYFL